MVFVGLKFRYGRGPWGHLLHLLSHGMCACIYIFNLQFTIAYYTFLGGYIKVLNDCSRQSFFLFWYSLQASTTLGYDTSPWLHPFYTTLITAFPVCNQPCASLVCLWPQFNLSWLLPSFLNFTFPNCYILLFPTSPPLIHLQRKS